MVFLYISFSGIAPSDILFISLHKIIPSANTVNMSSVSGFIGKIVEVSDENKVFITFTYAICSSKGYDWN